MVYIWLLHHGAHGMLYGAIGEFIVGVFVPDGFEVEIGTAEFCLEEGKVASVGDGFGVVVEVGVEWCCELVGFDARIIILL